VIFVPKVLDQVDASLCQSHREFLKILFVRKLE
jgi:hypothetical protein